MVIILLFVPLGLYAQMEMEQTSEESSNENIVQKKLSENINIVKKGDKYSIELRNADLGDVIRFFAYKYNLNIIADKNVTGTVTASLSNISIKEALKQILDSQGYTMTEVNNVIRVKKKPTPTKHFKLKNVSVKDIKEELASLLSSNGKMVLDENSNSIMVTDDEDHLSLVENFINNIDVKGKQVFIEAKFIETTIENIENLGIEWNIVATATGAKRPHTFPFRKTGAKSFYPDVGTDEGFSSPTGWPVLTEGYDSGDSDTTTSFWTLGTLDFSQTQAVLRALLSDSNTKIISNPQVAAINNQKAEISVSTEYPLPTYEINSDTGELTVSGYEYKDIGIILNVTPLITEDNYITMTIEPTVGTISNSVEAGVVELPVISSKKASTKVTIKDGQTIVIGGLISEDNSNVVKKVPLLGSIPLLGKLFSYKSKSNEKTELLIFVTPHIISPEGEKESDKRERQEKISLLYQQVESLQKQNRLDEAVVKLEEILNIDPKQEKAKQMLAEMEKKIAERKKQEKIRKDIAQAKDLYREGKYEQAKLLFQKVLKEDSTNSQAKQYLTLIKKKLEEEEQVKTLWKEANDLLFNQGKYQEAKAKFLELKMFRPQDKEVERLIKLCEEKIEQEKREKHIQQLLTAGKNYYQSGEYELAQSTFNKVLQIAPDNLIAKEYIGKINKLQEEKRKEELRRKKISELYSRSESYINAGEYGKALTILKGILRIEPGEKKAEQIIREVKERIAERKKQEKIKKDIAEAKDLYREGKYEQAKLLLEEILKQDESNPDAQRYIELINKKLEEEAKAKNLWEEGNDLFRKGKYQEAKSKFLELKSLKPEYKKLDTMIKLCEKKIEREKRLYIRQLLRSGKKAYANREYDSALKSFTAILKVDPGNKTAQDYISRINHIKEVEKKQKEVSKQVVTKEKKPEVPNNQEGISKDTRDKIKILLNEAYSAYNRGDWDYARGLYNIVLQLDPKNKTAYHYLKKMEQPQQIIEKSSDSEEITSYNHIATNPEEKEKTVSSRVAELFESGLQKFKNKDYQKAIELFEKVLLEDPNNDKAYKYLERCHQELVKIEEKEKKEKINYLINEGKGFIRDGQYDQAFDSFHKVMKIDPGNRIAQRYLKYLKNKVTRMKVRQAKDTILQLTRKQEQWISAELERADIYIQEGNYQQAREILTNILNVKKSNRALQLLKKIEIEQKKQLEKGEQKFVSPQEHNKPVKTQKEELTKIKKLYADGIKLYKQGKYKSALERFTQIINSGIDYKKNRVEKLSAICLEKIQQAEKEKLIERKYQLALKYFNMALYDQAIRLLLEVIDIKPNYKEANRYLKMATQRMEMLGELGEYEQSEVEVQN